ncbi:MULTISPECIES: ABC transporter ATP-binding protein [unclassified Virgibacillus]|uniref:ABC transporter ATP-binding protein n=1 Tax=unclassified Virgibacillus TaxID=2620237 RepID=UPI0024DEA6A6|nr:ABC transporter ATP-binding protein [Virgibacillus sp. LDC-1]
MSQPLLSVQNLDVSFTFQDGDYAALKNISFSVYPKEIVGIVGESGCGKSLTSHAILGMLPTNAMIKKGSIQYRGTDLVSLTNEEWQSIRGSAISMIFQEPMTSLNPLLTIGRQISEVLKKHTGFCNKEIKEMTIALMKEVGLPRAEELYRAYPHQLSGGMRQRVVIAIALIGEADLVIADEPTTALDVTIQLQILELFRKLKQTRNTSLVFISHDWGVIRKVCDRVIVMYAGHIVEEGPIEEILQHPKHPYTQGLIQSIPDYKKRGEPLHTIPGRVPALRERRGGCPFVDRCSLRMDICQTTYPEGKKHGNHQVKCHLYAQEAINI